MTVLRNEGRWDRSNVIYRDGQVAPLRQTRADPQPESMQYIDYGISILTPRHHRAEHSAGKRSDLAPLLNRLSLEGRWPVLKPPSASTKSVLPQGLRRFRTIHLSTRPAAPAFAHGNPRAAGRHSRRWTRRPHRRGASRSGIRSPRRRDTPRRPLPKRLRARLHLRRRRPAHHVFAQSGDAGLHDVAAGRQRPSRRAATTRFSSKAAT